MRSYIRDRQERRRKQTVGEFSRSQWRIVCMGMIPYEIFQTWALVTIAKGHPVVMAVEILIGAAIIAFLLYLIVVYFRRID